MFNLIIVNFKSVLQQEFLLSVNNELVQNLRFEYHELVIFYSKSSKVYAVCPCVLIFLNSNIRLAVKTRLQGVWDYWCEILSESLICIRFEVDFVIDSTDV